ncbi:MAG: lytic transglycosylase domain-containing protein [Pseudomonadota bacterium]
MHSLKHFGGLIGHCPETAVIESPAFRANGPAAAPINDATAPSWQIPTDRRMLDTDLETAQGRDRRTRSIASRDRTQVAIVPGAQVFDRTHYGHTVATTSASYTDAQNAAPDTSGDDEAILALRPQTYATAFDQTISIAARNHRVDPLLLHAVIKQESAYKPRATSHDGARGLMQVMPGTGRTLGVRNVQHLYDPQTNIDAGAKLLSQLWDRFDGNIDLVLAAYNAGEGAVRKYGNAVPPYRETRDYVVKVKANYQKLAAESGIAVNF